MVISFSKIFFAALIFLSAVILTMGIFEDPFAQAVQSSSQAQCLGWDGTWEGSTQGDELNGKCTIPYFASSPDFASGTWIACKRFKMKGDGAENGILDSGFCNNDSSVIDQPVWSLHNFETYSGSGYTRKSIVKSGIWNLSNKTGPVNCGINANALNMYLDTANWSTTGDFCVPMGQKLKSNLDYTKTTSSDFYEDCILSETCGCGSGFVPLGTLYEFDGSHILDGNLLALTDPNGENYRVQTFSSGTDIEGGQCTNEKIVKCLLLNNRSDTEYKVISGQERCIVPVSPPVIHYWIGGTWSANPCSDGQKLETNGTCSTCTASADEGNTACCQNTTKWWHAGTGGSGTCYKPKQYECEVIIKKAVFSPVPAAYDGYTHAGKAPSAVFRNTDNTCRISCDDADANFSDLGLPINDPSTTATNWQWKSFASTLDLNMNNTSAPFFAGTSASGSQCDWECESGYVKNGNVCDQSSTTNPTPDGTNVDYDPTNLPDEVIHPGINVRDYDALTQKRPADWTDSQDYFLSPGKDGNTDTWLRFQILKDPDTGNVGEGGELDPSNDGGEILRWKIVSKDTNGDPRTLTAIPGCFPGSGSGTASEGSSLCLDHFTTVTYLGTKMLFNDTGTHYLVALHNVHGRDSLDGSISTIGDFLSSGVQYPSLKLEYINAPLNKFGHKVPIEYQLLIEKNLAGIINLPSGAKILKIIGEIGGVKTVLNARVGGKKLAPFLNYVISVR